MLLLNLFTCPHCHQKLDIMDSHTGMKCPQCQLVYPIQEEIPFLTCEAAVHVKDWEEGKRQAHCGAMMYNEAIL